MLKIFLQVHWFRHSTTVLTSFLTVGISGSIKYEPHKFTIFVCAKYGTGFCLMHPNPQRKMNNRFWLQPLQFYKV